MPRTTSSVIRLARAADAGAIAELSRSQIENGLRWRWRPGRVQYHLGARDSTVIVAESDKGLSGFAIVRFAESSAHINLLAVNPDARRQGIATSLVAWITRSCRVAGIARIGLEVRLNNTGAIQCYEAMGFKSRGISKGYYDGIEDARLMVLVLINPDIEVNRPK